MRFGLGLALFFALANTAVGAQEPRSFDFSTLPDTQEARVRYLTSLVTANWNSAVRFPDTRFKSSAGYILVGIERREDVFFVRFLHENNGSTPLAAVGNTIIERNYLRNGDLLQGKIFLSNDPSCYLRLYPYNERTKIDIVLYGAVLKKGLTVPKLFYYLLRDPLSVILLYTKSFNWDVFFNHPEPESYFIQYAKTLTASRTAGNTYLTQILESLSRYETPEEFFSGYTNLPGAEEITTELSHPFTDNPDANTVIEYSSFPSYASGLGFPLSAVSALIHSNTVRNSNVLSAVFVQDGGRYRRLLLLSGFDEKGMFGILAYDPFTRAFLDWPAFTTSHRGAYARLVSISQPAQ